MINYSTGVWGVSLICRVRGSVFPKAFCVAAPNAALAVLLHFLYQEGLLGERDKEKMGGVRDIWSGYTFVLGFLIVFRNNQAVTRFWEGTALINQIRGEWFNAVSSLVSFCSMDESKKEEVRHFHYVLVRLASLLYCFALQQVCDLDDDTFEIMKIDTMDESSLEFLRSTHDRCELVLQWMQRLIVESNEARVVDIPAPILSRSFQELSLGIVNLKSVRKIKEVPFPFPYAQMITCMLLIHWLVTPLLAAATIDNPLWSAIMCFMTVSAFWCLYYIALEIDQPFGDDANDLPIREMQQSFNRSLMVLLDERAHHPPRFRRVASSHKRVSLMGCDSGIGNVVGLSSAEHSAAAGATVTLSRALSCQCLASDGSEEAISTTPTEEQLGSCEVSTFSAALSIAEPEFDAPEEAGLGQPWPPGLGPMHAAQAPELFAEPPPAPRGPVAFLRARPGSPAGQTSRGGTAQQGYGPWSELRPAGPQALAPVLEEAATDDRGGPLAPGPWGIGERRPCTRPLSLEEPPEPVPTCMLPQREVAFL